MLLPRLGWRTSPDTAVSLRDFTVRLGTSWLLSDFARIRRMHHLNFVRAAHGLPTTAPDPLDGYRVLCGVLRRVWQRVKWENDRKEVYWRLAVDGVALLGNSHLHGTTPDPCCCGTYPGSSQEPPRTHHFWTCSVAQTLLRDVERTAGCSVTRAHVWLMISPDAKRIRGCVWDVVCLAVLNALETARRYQRSRRPHGPLSCARACTVARARYQFLLNDFAALGLPEKGWDSVEASHPFLCARDGKLVVSTDPAPGSSG